MVTPTEAASALGISESDYNILTHRLETEMESGKKLSSAISDTFSYALRTHRSKNPSGLWEYAITEPYVRFKGGGESAKQSWRPVSGSGFEEFVVGYYNQRLPSTVRLIHPTSDQRGEALNTWDIDPDDVFTGGDGKVDVLVETTVDGERYLTGCLHLKTSFHGRMEHNREFSIALQDRGVLSIGVTLDADRFDNTLVKGELGGTDRRNGARKLVEQEGVFDSVYSFNNHTIESDEDTPSGCRIQRAEIPGAEDKLSKKLSQHAVTFSENLSRMQGLQW